MEPFSLAALAGCALLGVLFEKGRAKRKAARLKREQLAGQTTELERIIQDAADKHHKPAGHNYDARLPKSWNMK